MQKVASFIVKLRTATVVRMYLFLIPLFVLWFTCSAAAGNLSSIDRAALSLRYVSAAANGVSPVRSLLVRSMDG